jgi:hypothetical protein
MEIEALQAILMEDLTGVFQNGNLKMADTELALLLLESQTVLPLVASAVARQIAHVKISACVN